MKDGQAERIRVKDRSRLTLSPERGPLPSSITIFTVVIIANYQMGVRHTGPLDLFSPY